MISCMVLSLSIKEFVCWYVPPKPIQIYAKFKLMVLMITVRMGIAIGTCMLRYGM